MVDGGCPIAQSKPCSHVSTHRLPPRPPPPPPPPPPPFPRTIFFFLANAVFVEGIGQKGTAEPTL